MTKNPTHRLLLLLPAALAALALAACSDDNTEGGATVTNDCLVSKVTLGSLKRTIHTTGSKGQDSTYTVGVTGSLYPLHIDQLNNRIYNTDSLPVGTDARRVTFATLTASGSMLSIRSLVSGADTLFTATDSTDFSVPRVVKAYSSDGNSAREYEMRVNVHRQEPDSFVWRRVDGGAGRFAADYARVRVLCDGSVLYIYGQTAGEGGAGKLFLTVTPTAAPDFGTQTEVASAAGGVDISSIRLFGGAFHALAGGRPVVSRDGGKTFLPTGSAQTFQAYAGQGTDSLYALGGGAFHASADGVSWAECRADDSGNRPVREVCGALAPSRTNKNYESVITVGQKADGTACVWKHDIDRGGNFGYPWMYLPQTDELDGYACPALAQPVLLRYDSATLLAGVDGNGNVQPFYVSRDNGRTWRKGGLYHPAWANTAGFGAAADADNHLWVVCGGTGEVWRGRINRLGWKEEQMVYTKARKR